MKPVKIVLMLVLVAVLAACGSPEERAAGHLTKAEELFEAGDLVKAKLEAQNAAQIEPRNAQARMLLARIAEKDGNLREAVGHLLVAVDADPDYVDPHVKLGTYYFLAKATDQAAEQAAKALELAPDRADVRLLNARVRYLQGNVESALAQTDAALEADPAMADAYMFKAALAAEAEDWDAAFAVVDAGLKQVPTDKTAPLRQFRLQLLRRTGQDELLEDELITMARDFPDEVAYPYALAQFYLEKERVDDAERVLRDIVAADPADADRQITLARFLARNRDNAQAEKSLQAAIVANPEQMRLRLALASLYENSDQLDKAQQTYADVAAADPRSDEGLQARNAIVALHLRGEKLDEARQEVAAILKDVPDNPRALLYHAAFQFADQDYDGAIADLRVLLRKEEASEPGLLLLARSYVRSGQAVLAQDTYRRLLAVNPKHPQAPQELAALLASQGDTAEAEDVLRARLDVEPGDAAAAAGLVQTLLAQQDLAGAESEARKLVELNEDNALAQFQLGRVMQAKGSPEEAIAAYKSTLRQNPDATAALQGLVTVYVQNGRADEALAFLKQYEQDNPERMEAKMLEGAVHGGAGQLKAAESAYEAVIAAQPQAVRAYAALAGLRPDDADWQIRQYQRGLEANPGNVELGLLLASRYENSARWEDAITLYEDMLSRNPDNLIAVNNLAALLLDRRTDQASFARALEISQKLKETEQPAFLDTVGWAYYRTGDLGNAVRYLERSVAGAGQVPVLRYHLGMAYAANNNPVGAKQELGEALEIAKVDFPGIEEARAKLKELEAS